MEYTLLLIVVVGLVVETRCNIFPVERSDQRVGNESGRTLQEDGTGNSLILVFDIGVPIVLTALTFFIIRLL